ncbi:MAG: Fic family protein, partial [Candidatus Omnitrophica bacterium]|nr:Fic family protein [Candidatus Omnitrophota bacterium]
MEINKFKDSPAGKVLKTDRDYWAFIPNKLPPEINYTKELVNLASEANRYIGNLNGIGSLLP